MAHTFYAHKGTQGVQGIGNLIMLKKQNASFEH